MVAYTNNGLAVNGYGFAPTGVITATKTYPNVSTVLPGSWVIGSWSTSTFVYGNWSISNVQVYNTTMPQSDLAALYKRGIGGNPISLQNLVAWWPLNGNANDYSGHNYNANSMGTVNVIWDANWQNGYTLPVS